MVGLKKKNLTPDTKISPQMVNLRDLAGNVEEEEYVCVCWI